MYCSMTPEARSLLSWTAASYKVSAALNYISMPKINMNKQICGHQFSLTFLNSQYFGKGYELESSHCYYMLCSPFIPTSALSFLIPLSFWLLMFSFFGLLNLCGQGFATVKLSMSPILSHLLFGHQHGP
jgi:hypothetical protein